MTENNLKDISSMDLAGLTEFILSLGEKKFRARQIYDWINKKNAVSFAEMTDLSKALREKLAGEAFLAAPEAVSTQVSKIDGTMKVLYRMRDGSYVESVLMKYKHGNSVCISTQVGCRMGCAFCASTIGGLTRNLTAGEMLGQIYGIRTVHPHADRSGRAQYQRAKCDAVDLRDRSRDPPSERGRSHDQPRTLAARAGRCA